MKKPVFLYILIFAIFFIFLSAMANAEIFISQPKAEYNLNDMLSVDVSVKESYAVYGGLLRVSAVCPSGTINFYANGNVSLPANEQKQFNAVWSKISDVAGKCYIKAEFESETANTTEFIVTDKIDVSLELNKGHLQPNENLIISGKAIKANSMPAEGFAEIKIQGLVESQYANVKNGNFNLQLDLPSSTPSDEYLIQVLVFEKDYQGRVTNRGFADAEFYVNSVPSKLDLSINDENFLPDQTVTVKASLYDQSSQLIKENISIKIKDSGGKIAVDKITESGSNLNYVLEQNAVPGEWLIEASISDFKEKRVVYIEEYEAVSISLQDDEVIVKNIGNVPYKKPLEIKFIDANGIEQTKVQDVDLVVGDEAILKLSAPDGIYNVEIEDKKFTSVPLTGSVTASVQLEKKPGILSKYPVASFSIFILLLIISTILIQNLRGKSVKIEGIVPYRQEKQPVKVLEPKIEFKAKSAVSEKPQKAAEPVTPSKPIYPVKTAETALVLHGQKQNTSVLYFKAKNISELQGKVSLMALESLKNFAERSAVNAIESCNGAVHKLTDTEILGIFAPAMRQFRHEIAAVKAAKRIEDELNAQNRKLKARLDFGIGINAGELIINLKKVMQYTSVGKTIAIARRLAETAKNEIVISKDVHARVMPEVKAKTAGSIKVGDDEIDCYIVESISGREVYSSYIHDVLRRINKK